jgi:hypothetical protein
MVRVDRFGDEDDGSVTGCFVSEARGRINGIVGVWAEGVSGGVNVWFLQSVDVPSLDQWTVQEGLLGDEGGIQVLLPDT